MATIIDHGLSAIQAMNISIAEARTVRLKWSDLLEVDLLVDCDGSSDETLEDGSVLTTYWGGDEPSLLDAREERRTWQVALLAKTAGHVGCACGAWSGEACQWTGPRADTVVVEYMPEQFRAAHAECGNSGSYPANGSRRVRVASSCAEQMVECDTEWVEILGDA